MNISIRDIFPSKVNKANYYYIIINLCVSAFSFFRSFIFMHVLDLRELGVISLVQTIFMFIGLLQIGLLNGGYRIISLGKREQLTKANNTIFSYIAMLVVPGLAFCFLSNCFNWIDDMSLPVLLIAVFFGIFTLVNNWLHNALIGEQRLGEVNKLNIISFGASMFALPVAYFAGFWGGMLVITIQPLLFVLVCLVDNKELRPTKFMFDLKYVNYILTFGFIPFLGGIFTALYTQIERWSITEVLSVEALGGFYLVFLYVSLYHLVPSSVNSIFFPKAVKAYEDKHYTDFKKYIKWYYAVLIAYGALISLVTVLFLRPVVSLVFPNHLPGVELVYIIMPGIILQSLSEPIGLILNSAVILKPMLVVNSLNLLLCICLIILYIATDVFSLTSVSMLRSISGAFVFIAYIAVFFIIKKQLFKTDRI